MSRAVYGSASPEPVGGDGDAPRNLDEVVHGAMLVDVPLDDRADEPQAASAIRTAARR